MTNEKLDIFFKPNVAVLDKSISYIRSVREIESEPMLYGASWKFAKEEGGPITKHIMDSIEADVMDEAARHTLLGYHPVIDTKSVMLMPGWCPCIPGWHCDGVIRPSPTEQPNVATLSEDIKHYTSWVGSDEALPATQFLTKPWTIEGIDPDHLWGDVDKKVEENIEKQGPYGLGLLTTCSGQIAKFNRPTLHRGLFSDIRGWRFFFRLSFYHMPAMNEIRKQVQVYPQENIGW